MYGQLNYKISGHSGKQNIVVTWACTINFINLNQLTLGLKCKLAKEQCTGNNVSQSFN